MTKTNKSRTKSKRTSILMQNSVFVWIAAITAILLLVPYIAMQFSSEVNWSSSDFAVMGALLFGSGSGFVLVARRTDPARRVLVALLFAALFMYIWAELAVGVFIR